RSSSNLPVPPGATSAASVETRVGESQPLSPSTDGLSRGVGASLVTPAFQVCEPTFLTWTQPLTVWPSVMGCPALVAAGQDCDTNSPEKLGSTTSMLASMTLSSGPP